MLHIIKLNKQDIVLCLVFINSLKSIAQKSSYQNLCFYYELHSMRMHNHNGLVEKKKKSFTRKLIPTVYCVYLGILSSCDMEFSGLKVNVIKICEES